MKNTLRSTLTAYSRYITETWLNVSLAANIYHRGNIWSEVLLESSNSLRYINSEGGKSPTISSHIVLKDFITKNKYLKEWHKTKFGWLVVLFAIFLFIFLFCRLTLKLKKKNKQQRKSHIQNKLMRYLLIATVQNYCNRLLLACTCNLCCLIFSNCSGNKQNHQCHWTQHPRVGWILQGFCLSRWRPSAMEGFNDWGGLPRSAFSERNWFAASCGKESTSWWGVGSVTSTTVSWFKNSACSSWK